MPAHEIDAGVFEHEIRAGAPIVIVDIRDEDSFEHWSLDAGITPIVNIPAARIAADPGAAIEQLGGGTVPIRVLCARGRAAISTTEQLSAAGARAATVSGGMEAWARLLTAADVALPTPTAVTQLRREARGCLSYVVASDGEALVVDPGLDVDAYLRAAAAHRARITAILDTHVHADHLSGMWRLAELTGARRYLSTGAQARGGDPTATAVRDGEALAVGSAHVEVIELPGHTSDNVGLLVDEVALIAGDSLFADSVARPDLETGDEGAAESARLLYRTLRERILPLPQDTVLLPCHYAGGRRTAPVAPTLREVRAETPVLALDEPDFVAQVLGAMPPRPENYEQIIAANLALGIGDNLDALEIGGNNCAASAHP